MTAAMLALAVKRIQVPRLSVEQRTAKLEDLASATGLDRQATEVQLRWLCHPGLKDGELWDLWLAFSDAAAIRDATDPAEWDYETYDERAKDKIHDLIHGMGTARGRGNHTGETAS